jgi:hypothetical protein
MQRLEAKKSTRETVMPAETGNLKTVDENPRRNGLFSIDDGLRGSGRLDGETEGTELPTPHAVFIEPVSDSESGTEFFDAETGA